MNKLEEKKEKLAARIADLKARLEKLETQMAETEEAIRAEEHKKTEERRNLIADTVEKVLGIIPVEEAAGFEEFLELFREAYAPAIKVEETTDGSLEEDEDFFDFGQAAGNEPDNKAGKNPAGEMDTIVIPDETEDGWV